MQLGRFLVEAVVLGKQSPNRLVREHPISRSWFYELLARYRREGPAGLEPRTHRPARCPHQVESTCDGRATSMGCCVCHKHCCRAYLGAGELLRRG
jgi:hypothetical protein